jgi:hypothetical protein
MLVFSDKVSVLGTDSGTTAAAGAFSGIKEKLAAE